MVYIVLLWMMMSEDASTKLWVRGSVGILGRGEVEDGYGLGGNVGIKILLFKNY